MSKNSPYHPIMFDVLQEKADPPFRIERITIPSGYVDRNYLREEGRIVHIEATSEFRTVALFENERGWMVDTPFEFEGMANHLRAAKGRVLVGGLGLGMFPHLIAPKRKVRKVDIVEQQEKVIGLEFPQIWHPKLRIIHDDIFRFLQTTKIKYDFIYLDIWPDFIGPIKDVDRAVSDARRCLKNNGIIKVWLQELIDRVRNQLPKEPQFSGGVGLYDPCLVCGKMLRNDYGGLCMDCGDALGVSEMYLSKQER